LQGRELAMTSPVISIRGLSKSFGTNKSLDDVDLDIWPGQLVGLVGPNGAGKSTLIKILDGVYSRDAGSIEFEGNPVRSLGDHANVAFIHQDLGLIDDLSIAANLQLGQPPRRTFGPFLHFSAEREYAMTALRSVGLSCPVTRLVGELSPGEKTLVAIARAMSVGANVLFVDEATSTLPLAEARRVTSALKQAAAEGAAVIMVTHKLQEILNTTERIVLLVDGKIAADRTTATLNADSLIEILVGHGLAEQVDSEDCADPAGTLIEMSDVRLGPVGPVNFKVRSGEVVGLTGLAGSGLYLIARIAHGSMKPESGSVVFDQSVRRSLLPEHREALGGFDDLTVRENLALGAVRRWRGKLGLVNLEKERAACEDVSSELSVRPTGIERPYGALSGGNKQKVLLGRLLLEQPGLYVLCEPTRGVDVATRHAIYALIRKLGQGQAGVLLISSDAEDLFAVCSRVGVVREDGRVDEPVEFSALDSAAKRMML
jgi:ribose transport system ATP-binding protein